MAEIPIPELDLFAVPPVQKTITETKVTRHRPTSTVDSWNSSSSFNFKIDVDIDEVLLLHESYFVVEFDVIKGPRGDVYKPSATEFTSFLPCNYMMHGMISKIQIEGCGEPILIEHYPYKAYLEALLGYSDSAKNTLLKAALWGDNVYRKDRVAVVDKETSIQLVGKLHIDFNHQCRGFIGGSRFNIKVYGNDPKFYLNYDKAIKTGLHVCVKKAEFVAKRFKISEKKFKAINQVMLKRTTKYPLTVGRVFEQVIPTGNSSYYWSNAINGVLPRRIFLAFVLQSDYSGGATSNPFAFQNFKVAFVYCSVNGTTLHHLTHEVDFTNGEYFESYYRLLDSLNQTNPDPQFTITPQQFQDNCCIFAFNLSQDESSGVSIGGHWNVPKSGQLSLQVNFDEPLAENVQAILYAEFDELYEQEYNRNIKKVVRNEY